MVFTSIPFVVRTVQPVLEELGPEYEKASQTLGAGHWQTFRRVILFEVAPAMLAVTALSFTRSLGEFGAVILAAVWRNLNDSDMLHAIWLTVLIALVTVPVNVVFDTLMA